jgi:hypothetical protein
MDRRLSPGSESSVVAELLKSWALRNALDLSTACAQRSATSLAATV